MIGTAEFVRCSSLVHLLDGGAFICGRPNGHPSALEDGVGHAPHLIPADWKNT